MENSVTLKKPWHPTPTPPCPPGLRSRRAERQPPAGGAPAGRPCGALGSGAQDGVEAPPSVRQDSRSRAPCQAHTAPRPEGMRVERPGMCGSCTPPGSSILGQSLCTQPSWDPSEDASGISCELSGFRDRAGKLVSHSLSAWGATYAPSFAGRGNLNKYWQPC